MPKRSSQRSHHRNKHRHVPVQIQIMFLFRANVRLERAPPIRTVPVHPQLTSLNVERISTLSGRRKGYRECCQVQVKAYFSWLGCHPRASVMSLTVAWLPPLLSMRSAREPLSRSAGQRRATETICLFKWLFFSLKGFFSRRLNELVVYLWVSQAAVVINHADCSGWMCGGDVRCLSQRWKLGVGSFTILPILYTKLCGVLISCVSL